MKGSGDYRNITASVRTPRCAILINEASKYWMTAATSAIRHSSEVWGGSYFLIIPTDGQRIKGEFWKILEAHDPDYIAEYQLSFADLKDADPEQYQASRASWKEKYEKEDFYPSFENWFTQSTRTSTIDALSLSPELIEELISRLNPFQFGSSIIQQRLRHALGFRYPFTKITAILPFASNPVERILIPKVPSDPVVALMTHAITGVASADHQKQLAEIKLESETPPATYPAWLFAERTLGSRPWETTRGQSWDIPADFSRVTPFGLSAIHLSRYYRVDRHHDYQESTVVILGDSVDDFCLYYSLSRLHDDVHWLPLTLLSDEHKRYRANRRRPAHSDPVSATARNRLTLFWVNHLLQGLDRHDQPNRRIALFSSSLNISQLRARKRQMIDLSYASEEDLHSKLTCNEMTEIPTDCIGHVIEENNHSTFQSAVFIDNASVSPVETPKPKNFTKINVPYHSWLTSLLVEGFAPPPLHPLGSMVIVLQGLAGNTRIANDGLVYECPNGAYFGGDVDVITVRPRLQLVDEMTIFGAYFDDITDSIRYSDKGNYFLDTIRRFGDLNAAGTFIKAPSTRGILDEFVTRPSRKHGGVIFLDADQRAYLDFTAINRHIGDVHESSALIDTLIGKSILERGLILQCQRCRLSSWYSLNLLTTDFRCNRCSMDQQLTRTHWKNPPEPRWYYKLAETVYQCYKHNSHVTIQVLHKLKGSAERAFHFAPEIDLLEYPERGRSSEIDVACIMDGKIIIGECKTEPLKPSHITKYSTLLSRLPRRPDRLVFATSSPTISVAFTKSIEAIPGAEALVFDDLFDS